MMQARQGITFNFLKLHEEALAIDDAFEIDEAFKIVEHEHMHHSIAEEIHFNNVSSDHHIHDAQINYHDAVRLYEQFIRQHLIS